MKTLLLKFSGPMQSWGTSSHYETRQTDPYPSKSGVIGMIAASMGYRRDEDEKMKRLNDVNFAVRIDQKGKLLRDYHIAAKYSKRGILERNYVTQRYYLEDAVFVVALSSDNDAFIEEIKSNIEKPYFQPYLGRRSCPIPANFIIEMNEDDPIDALKSLEWQAAKWYQKENVNYTANIYADANMLYGRRKQKWDLPLSFSDSERKYGHRYVTRTSIYFNIDENCDNTTKYMNAIDEDIDFFDILEE